MDWLPFWLRPVPAPALLPNDDKPLSVATSSPAPLSSTPSPYYPIESLTAEQDVEDSGPIQSIPITGFTLGFCTGLYQAGKRSSLVFMAENAHRRPNTVQGWYFYNKTKNYKVLLAGIMGGIKTGTRVGLWTLAYVGIEYGVTRLQRETLRQRGVDHAMQWSRLVAGGVAGLSVAGGASLLYRLPGPIARRALLLGIVTGSSVGALRDAQQLISHRNQETA